MAFVLFPGRHHLLTNFQLEYLTMVTSAHPDELKDIEGEPLKIKEKLDTVIWVVTSANHSNTRRNPLPGNKREVMIERFSDLLGATSFVYLIDDVGHSDKYGEYCLKKIEVESLGRHRLTPENTVVACSTPAVIAMYEGLGFQILPVELEDREKGTYNTTRPWEIVEAMVNEARLGQDWRTNKLFLTKAAKSSRDLYLKYNYGDLVIDLFEDPILGGDGDLTETRDYSTYARAFDEGAARKYELVKEEIKPGRIVDIGCATGALIKQMSGDGRLRESDLYGVEVSRQLFSICQQRKDNREFKNENVFFYQRNIVRRKVFPDNSINTFTAFSLTHELESYAGREALITFLKQVYEQLALGGVFIDLDVVGPRNKKEEVYVWFKNDDGSNELRESSEGLSVAEINEYVGGLSTYARFLQFARDFRAHEGYRVEYRKEKVKGEELIKTSLFNVAEFISKKDYTDNWQSEMHETFCFWDLDDWEKEIGEIGFKLGKGSKTFTNEWIVENRYRGKAKIMDLAGKELEYPPTNMILVAEKA